MADARDPDVAALRRALENGFDPFARYNNDLIAEDCLFHDGNDTCAATIDELGTGEPGARPVFSRIDGALSSCARACERTPLALGDPARRLVDVVVRTRENERDFGVGSFVSRNRRRALVNARHADQIDVCVHRPTDSLGPCPGSSPCPWPRA